MNYPQPPWNLKGFAVHTLSLVDIRRSRQFIPPELEIVSILPGKTLGGIYLSAYGEGSLLQYNELIVVAGLTRYQNKVGSWISHIYVDNRTSVAGGRGIWQLPKELADFSWEADSDPDSNKKGKVTVKQNDHLLCRLEYKKEWYQPSIWWQQGIAVEAFSGLDTELWQFNNRFKCQFDWLSGKVQIPVSNPFASLNLEQPLLTVKMNQLDLVAGKPEVMGKKSNSQLILK